MRAEYERNLQSSWMILEEQGYYEEDFQMKMLNSNTIPGLLEVQGQGKDDKSRYRYNISGMISMEQLGKNDSWTCGRIEEFMKQFIEMLYAIHNYLLNADCISLDTERIFYKDRQFYFCYCPSYKGNIYEEFHILTEYFVRETNYDDKEAIYLSCELHKASMEHNYCIEQVLEGILERKETALEEMSVTKGAIEYEKREEVILDDWAEDHGLENKVFRERQSVWGFVSKKMKKRQRNNWTRWEQGIPEE